MSRLIGFLLLTVLNIDNPALPQGTTPTRDEMRGAAIHFERFGGFAGVSTRFWIYADGRILNAEGKESRTLPKNITSLLSRIRALILPIDRRPSYCMDCFHYRVTITSPSGMRSFIVDEEVLHKTDPEVKVINDLRTLLLKQE